MIDWIGRALHITPCDLLIRSCNLANTPKFQAQYFPDGRYMLFLYVYDGIIDKFGKS